MTTSRASTQLLVSRDSDKRLLYRSVQSKQFPDVYDICHLSFYHSSPRFSGLSYTSLSRRAQRQHENVLFLLSEHMSQQFSSHLSNYDLILLIAMLWVIFTFVTLCFHQSMHIWFMLNIRIKYKCVGCQAKIQKQIYV